MPVPDEDDQRNYMIAGSPVVVDLWTISRHEAEAEADKETNQNTSQPSPTSEQQDSHRYDNVFASREAVDEALNTCG